jgi:hypothetical protein
VQLKALRCHSVAQLMWSIAALTIIAGSLRAADVVPKSQEIAVDKSAFSLFNPTPAAAMREMSTDRPDTTESPYTVDAGHLQLEMSFAGYSYNNDHGTKNQGFDVLPLNLKVGLLNNVDIQFVITPYQFLRSDAPGERQTADGFGDSLIRLKINLWGNDAGDTAFGIMPYVKIPSGTEELSNDRVEGGLILPLSIALPQEFSLGLMAQFDAAFNDATGNYGVNLVHTATLSHALVGSLAGYVEYIGIVPYETGGTYQAIGSAGLTYAINENWVVDCGTTVGLSSSADDVTLFLGMSFRY